MAFRVMSPIRPWAPVIGAVAIALLSLVVGSRTGRTVIDLAPLPATVHVRGKDVANLGAELSAPLFAPSRTVGTAGANPATPPAPPPQLMGVVLGGGRAVALVKSAGGGATLMLHTGDTVDGWTVVGIAARQIAVARDDVQQVVNLEFGVSKAPTGDAPATAAVGAPNKAVSPSFDGFAAAARLGLPAQNIPLGSPLVPLQW